MVRTSTDPAAGPSKCERGLRPGCVAAPIVVIEAVVQARWTASRCAWPSQPCSPGRARLEARAQRGEGAEPCVRWSPVASRGRPRRHRSRAARSCARGAGRLVARPGAASGASLTAGFERSHPPPEAGAHRPPRLPQHAPVTDPLSPATPGCSGRPTFVPRTVPRRWSLQSVAARLRPEPECTWAYFASYPMRPAFTSRRSRHRRGGRRRCRSWRRPRGERPRGRRAHRPTPCARGECHPRTA
jgi:hypothetical protein